MQLNLQKDQQRIRQFVQKRIRNYPVYENLGPGEDEDPIRLITLGFYAEQGGYVALVFDTRPKAEVDGKWTLYLENDTNVLDLPKWCDVYEAAGEGKTVTIVGHDRTSHEITDNDIDDEQLNALFGEMLTALMHELRDKGEFAKLPLDPKAFMVIEEFDGRYFWPTYETRKTEGAIVR